MFFNINKKSLKNYPVQYELMPDIILNCDQGWHRLRSDNVIVYSKGYCNTLDLQQLMARVQPIPKFKGNFLAVVVQDDKIYITHDTNRGTPIYLGNDYISNLEKGEPVWADCLLKIKSDFTVEKTYFEPCVPIDYNPSDEEIIEGIHKILCETFENFLTHNTLPLKIFLSGGIDTMTLYSYLQQFTNNFELVDYEYIKHTHFYKKNITELKKNWCYNQMHLWEDPCVLVSGASGDENMLRGPKTLEIALTHHGTNLHEVCKRNPTGYHYKYFSKKDIQLTNNELVCAKSIKGMKKLILNRNLNDFQHWHLDKTLTFTPFKDLDLLQLILKGSKDLIQKQAADAYINKELIKLTNSSNLKLISNYKNFDTFENFN